jgi:hypothetical protein
MISNTFDDVAQLFISLFFLRSNDSLDILIVTVLKCKHKDEITMKVYEIQQTYDNRLLDAWLLWFDELFILT